MTLRLADVRSRRTAPRTGARPPGSAGSARRARRPSACGPEVGEQLVGVHQVDERGRDRAVLGLALAEEHVRARRDRDARGDVDRRHVADVRARGRARPRAATRAGWRRPSRGPTQAGSSCAASVGVMPISPASAIASISASRSSSGPAIRSSRWTLPVRKKWNAPVPIPTDIRRVERPAREVEAADPVDRPLHLPRGAARPSLVVRARRTGGGARRRPI